MEQDQPQNTLRDTLSSNLEAAEQGTLDPAAPPPAPERPRDEAGRFAAKQREEAAAAAATTPAVQPAPAQPPQWSGPSTWKKEFRPLYDKLATGQPLTAEEARKLAQYNLERENDFKTGVSTYKAEAERSKQIQEAITPFLPELQANGVHPAQWIKQMGQAHYALSKGTPELKLEVFRQLARQFNVPIGAVAQDPQQVPPIVAELMGQIHDLQSQVRGVASWRQQQEETSLSSEIQKYERDTENYPFFQKLRGTMAQLLESGLAPDLPTAYKHAEWMDEEARAAAIARTTPRANPVPQARARAVSPRSATPSGQVATPTAKDRRSVLEQALNDAEGGRV